MHCTPETTSQTPATPPDPRAAPEMAATVLQLPVGLQRQLEVVVDAAYPFEACGVMIGRTEPKGRSPRQTVVVDDVFLARNLNVERARDRFLLDPEDHLAADREARGRGLDIVGFWHSHPDHPARPSATDLEAAWKDHSYLIVSTAAFGTNVLRSWRLDGGRFLEERIDQLSSAK